MLRHTRSPACGSPDTSSTLSRSRTPLMTTDGAVVDEGQLLRPGLDLEVRGRWGRHGRSGSTAARRGRPAPSAGAARRHPCARSARLQLGGAPAAGLRLGRSSTRTVSGASLPTSPKLGACVDHEPAVALAGMPGQQHVQRRAELHGRRRSASPAGTSCTSPSVIMMTAARRLRGMSASARFSAANNRVPSSPRRAAACRRGRRAHRGRAPASTARVSAASAAAVACAAVADLLARRFVDDDDRDVAQRRALLLDQRRVDEDCRAASRPPRRARRCRAPAATAPRRQHQQGRARERGDRRATAAAARPPAYRRCRRSPRSSPTAATRRGRAAPPHWPSRSRIAGTCTWSLL